MKTVSDQSSRVNCTLTNAENLQLGDKHFCGANIGIFNAEDGNKVWSYSVRIFPHLLTF